MVELHSLGTVPFTSIKVDLDTAEAVVLHTQVMKRGVAMKRYVMRRSSSDSSSSSSSDEERKRL